MMVEADHNECQGYGICALTADRVFSLDDDGYVSVLIADDIPPDLRDATAQAVESCPVQALRLIS